jgi:Uma2 family endonuclease
VAKSRAKPTRATLEAMTTALRPRYTLGEYIDVEDGSIGVKHEYVGGEIYAMSGGSPEHAALTSALAVIIGARLRGTPCRTYSSDLRLAVSGSDVFTYADLTVVCDPLERHPDSPSHVTNPRIVVEVLSPSTERYDREQKRLYYQQIESLQEYVLVAQDRRRVEVWRREGDDWGHTIYEAGAGARLGSIDLELVVDELYDEAGVHLRAPSAG